MSTIYASYDGYGENYKTLLPMLKKRDDMFENACRLGAHMDKEHDGVRISCLGRDYIITREDVKAADGKPSDENLRGVLIYYANSQGAGTETGEYVLLNRLTGMIDGHKGLAEDMFSSILVRNFNNDLSQFDAAISRFNGEKLPRTTTGKHVWRLRVLPVITMQFVFYEADAEFPAEFQVMFDSIAPRFLEFECLAFLTGSVLSALIGRPI